MRHKCDVTAFVLQLNTAIAAHKTNWTFSLCNELMNLTKISLNLPRATSYLKTLPSFALTTQERDEISQNPFFQPLNETIRTNRKDPVPLLIQQLRRYIPLDEDGLLTMNRPDNALVPFEMYKTTDHEVQILKLNSDLQQKTRFSLQTFPRLSVTRLLTQNWCELREWYRVFAGGDVIETKRMAEGKKIHQTLENELHPPIDWSTLDGGKLIGIQTVGEFSWLFENLLRLRSLIVEGEAREVYIFSFMDKKTGEFTLNTEGSTPITGIIDYLALNQVFAGYQSDISNFVEQVENEDLSETTMSIIDIKTRSMRKIPTQRSVLDGAKLQVMYYAQILEQFSTVEKSLQLFESYFKAKSIDIDEPIALESVLFMLENEPEMLLNDYIQIHSGTLPHPYLSSNDHYECTEFEHSISSELLLPFTRGWKQPLTMRYLILRNAQLMAQISKLVNKRDLNVQYYCGSQMFHEVRFELDEQLLRKNSKEAMEFWMGERDPKPLGPGYSNVTSKCKYCEFKDYCKVYESSMARLNA